MATEIIHDRFELVQAHAGYDVCALDDQDDWLSFINRQKRGRTFGIRAEFSAPGQHQSHFRMGFVPRRSGIDPFAEPFERMLTDVQPAQVIEAMPALKWHFRAIVWAHVKISLG